ncbi:hypothetical protein GBA63_04245 [Rubrobacter tropicus]|uniref:Uncharacterized protein n=1 Tax=Rubrobacter tropicus TaxID=2653851 RepID=A0A6G8Q658_9ACTN|nr:DUF2182 domain-containing protein [Rubrobacter tropicus]QIN81940.1 hypothetical protein GBA63_04245 [Rubrobacter tropicus]
MWAAPRDDHNRLFFVLMATLIALAWLALWAWGRSPGGLFYGHHDSTAFARGGSFVLVFVIGWTVMVVAMMLPTSLPLITLFRTIARQRRDRALLVALLIAGYIGTWTLFGGVVYLGGWALHRLIGQSGLLEANTWVLGAGIIMLAGLYQFTPLKYKCLEKCRSPLSFVTEHWRGNRERSQAFRLGVHHGLFCVGCCWSLMLLMFVVGAGSLGWMLVLGAVMAVEKNVSWGRRIGAPLGVVLLGFGLTLGIAPALQSSARIPLAPANDSAVSGTANFTDTSGGIEIRLDVEGLPDPGAMYLAHIHPGSCAGEPAGNDENHGRHQDHGHHSDAGEIEHPLTPVVSGTSGDGSSDTVIEGFTVAQLFSGGESYVNVHAESYGSQGPAVSLACGDLGRR